MTRAVRKAIARIAEHHPQLGEHLDRAVRTGTFCATCRNLVATAGGKSDIDQAADRMRTTCKRFDTGKAVLEDRDREFDEVVDCA